MQNVDSLFLKIPSCTYGTIPLVLHGKTNCTTQPDKRKVNQLNKLQLNYLHKSIKNNFNAVVTISMINKRKEQKYQKNVKKGKTIMDRLHVLNRCEPQFFKSCAFDHM